MATFDVPERGNQSAKVISVVDDDQSVRSAIVSLLRSEGFPARSFSSAEDFLSSGAITVTGCLILDVRMKGMSGLELQSALSAAGAAVPIVFISAHADSDASARAMGAGAVGFLSKPFSKEDLLGCIETAMAGRQ